MSQSIEAKLRALAEELELQSIRFAGEAQRAENAGRRYEAGVKDGRHDQCWADAKTVRALLAEAEGKGRVN